MGEVLVLPNRSGTEGAERAYRIALTTPVWASVSWQFLKSWSCLTADVMGPKGEWAGWLMHISAGSLLPMARNSILTALTKLGVGLTHVVMVDSDVIGLTGEHVRRLVEHDVPIVAPLVCLREADRRPACEADDGFKAVYDELDSEEPGLVPRRWVGTGCICIKWGVLEDMAIEYETPDGKTRHQWFRCCNEERVSWRRDWQEAVDSGVRRTVDLLDNVTEGDDSLGALAEILTQVWMQGRDIWNGGRQLGEDVEFGTRAGSKGYRSFIDCGIRLGHLAEREVTLRDHLDFVGRTDPTEAKANREGAQ